MFGRRGVELAQVEIERCRAELSQQGVRNEHLLQQLAESQAEVRRLTNILIDMKRDGFHPASTQEPVPDTPSRDLPSDVLKAIQSRARPGSDLYSALVEDAWQMLEVEARPESEVVRLTKYGAAGVRDEEDEWK